MPRFHINDGPINVAYGFEELDGSVFLIVCDGRLQSTPEATARVNAVANSIFYGDGEGAYFTLYTGAWGLGLQVDNATMATFLRRFGVSDGQIAMLPLVLDPSMPSSSPSSHHLCGHCRLPASKRCHGCRKEQSIFYCSKECQEQDWRVHKNFCGCEMPVEQRVTALLLREEQIDPVFVHLSSSWESSDGIDPGFWKLDTSSHIPGIRERIRCDQYTYQDPKLTCSYVIIYKSDSLVDGESKENACARKLLKAKAKSEGERELTQMHWRNNILVVKMEKNKANGKYQDMSIEDTSHAASLLYKITKAYTGAD